MIYQNIVTGSMLLICMLEDLKDRRIRSSSLIFYAIAVLIGKPEDILTGTVPGIFCLFLSWVSRQKFGYGDSLAILICGISLGITQGCRTVIYAFFLSGIAALLYLMAGRTGKDYEIPFLPFLFAGWMQTVLIIS